MPVIEKLSFFSQFLQGLLFKNSIISLDIIQHLRLAHKKSTVDPGAVTFWFFEERIHPVTRCLQCPKSSFRLYGRHSNQVSIRLMKTQQLFQIDICDSVAVGQ